MRSKIPDLPPPLACLPQLAGPHSSSTAYIYARASCKRASSSWLLSRLSHHQRKRSFPPQCVPLQCVHPHSLVSFSCIFEECACVHASFRSWAFLKQCDSIYDAHIFSATVVRQRPWCIRYPARCTHQASPRARVKHNAQNRQILDPMLSHTQTYMFAQRDVHTKRVQESLQKVYYT